MFTPVLNPNGPSSAKTNVNAAPPPSQHQVELGKILMKNDPHAVRLYDYVSSVKVFAYNVPESRWEPNAFLEGDLFIYKRQQTVHNQVYQAFAFAVIQGDRHLLQTISADMSEQANELCLFYEITRNQKSHVFSLHFSNERECHRVHSFIQQALQKVKEQQQLRLLAVGEPQQQQPPSANIQQSQTTVPRPDSVTPQLVSAPQVSAYVPARQATPVASYDPSLSLKRLLNISSPQSVDREPGLSSPQQTVDLLPPSAFESAAVMMPSPADTGYGYPPPQPHTVPPGFLSREHLRNTLLHLVQHNDHFLDIIHQAYLKATTS